MPIQCFTLVLDRVPTDKDLDRLFEVGCDDAMPGIDTDVPVLEFDREAPTLDSAIASAVRATEAAGLHVVRVLDQKLLTLHDITDRTGISHETLTAYAAGTQGPGTFPSTTGPDGGAHFYQWAEVAEWLRGNGFLTAATETEAVLVRTNSALDTTSPGNGATS